MTSNWWHASHASSRVWSEGEWVSEWVSECVSEWVSEIIGDRGSHTGLNPSNSTGNSLMVNNRSRRTLSSGMSHNWWWQERKRCGYTNWHVATDTYTSVCRIWWLPSWGTGLHSVDGFYHLWNACTSLCPRQMAEIWVDNEKLNRRINQLYSSPPHTTL